MAFDKKNFSFVQPNRIFNCSKVTMNNHIIHYYNNEKV